MSDVGWSCLWANAKSAVGRFSGIARGSSFGLLLVTSWYPQICLTIARKHHAYHSHVHAIGITGLIYGLCTHNFILSEREGGTPLCDCIPASSAIPGDGLLLSLRSHQHGQ